MPTPPSKLLPGAMNELVWFPVELLPFRRTAPKPCTFHKARLQRDVPARFYLRRRNGSSGFFVCRECHRKLPYDLRSELSKAKTFPLGVA